MAIAFGVLLWSAANRWKVGGLLGLVIAMIAGFSLGQLHIVSAILLNTALFSPYLFLPLPYGPKPIDCLQLRLWF
jgi:hypothetical protein